MKHLLIVYHTQSGSTRLLAEAACQSVIDASEVEVRLLAAMEAGVDDLRWADGVIFGSPENLGYLSGGLKDFFDRTFYPAQNPPINVCYGVFISAGNDGSGAVRQLARIVKGYPMRLIAEPVIVRGPVTDEGLTRCAELAAALSAGLAMGIF